MCITFSYDGQWLASGLWNGNIQILDVMTGKAKVGGGQVALEGHTDAVSAVAFLADGK